MIGKEKEAAMDKTLVESVNMKRGVGLLGGISFIMGSVIGNYLDCNCKRNGSYNYPIGIYMCNNYAYIALSAVRVKLCSICDNLHQHTV